MRRGLIWRSLAQAESLRPGHAVDVGGEAGHAAYAVAPFCARTDTIDAGASMLTVVAEEARRRGLAHLRTIRAQTARLPYPNACVDLVTCRYSAHHWLDLGAGLAEIRRILRPQGVLLVTDSAGAANPLVDTHVQTIELLRDPSHVRNRRPDEWEDALDRAGFVLNASERSRIRLRFADWVARARTPADRIAVIRDILTRGPAGVRAVLDVQNDGSFLLDVIALVARA